MNWTKVTGASTPPEQSDELPPSIDDLFDRIALALLRDVCHSGNSKS